MIIDAHAHYMAEPQSGFEVPANERPSMDAITVDEVVQAAAEAGVDRIVQVTPSLTGYDNSYSFQGSLLRPDKVLGVVGRMNPLLPDAFDRLKSFFETPNALGIRITLFQDGTENWLVDRELDDFLVAAAKIDVPICIFAPFQNEEIQATVRRHPDVRFIVDHMNIRYGNGISLQQAYRKWPQLISLAKEPNVWIKVSYFPETAMDSEPYPYPSAQLRFKELYEAVGSGRFVWGSNFPPVQRACSYRQALDFIRNECEFLSEEEKADILGGNYIREFGRGLL